MLVERCDVAVIGAGLAGLWCARALARRGVSVLLADAKPTVDCRVHTTGIFVRPTLEDFELPPGVLGRPIRQVVLYSPQRKALRLQSRHDEFRLADMRSLYRFLLADCLRAGVTWSPRTHYRGLVRLDGQLSVVRLQEKMAAAKFVVGADGARSRVAADLGLSSNRRFIFGVENVYESAILAEPPTIHCVLDPAIAPGYLAWVVHEGHEVHVGTAGDPKRFRVGAALKRFEAEAAGWVDLRAARLKERRGGWIPVNGVLSHIACGQGLLVGDAAGAPSPLTGGGLDPCIRLSEFAAGILADALATGSKAPLAAYSGRRFAARLFPRRCMRAVLHSASPQVLEVACALMLLPGPRQFADRVFFGRGSSPDSLQQQRQPCLGSPTPDCNGGTASSPNISRYEHP